MERVSGTFWRGGMCVAEDADVFLYVDVRTQPLGWFGSFELPLGAQMSQPGDYQVEFADGRHGVVTVSLTSLLGEYRYGGFTGNGPLHGPHEGERGGS